MPALRKCRTVFLLLTWDFLFPLPTSSDIEVLSSCVRSCAIPTQATSFPFTDRARCLGEWAAGLLSEPRAGMSSRCCCQPGAGCWGSGMGSLGKCSWQVCGKFGKLQKEKGSRIILSVVSSVAPCQKEWATAGRWEETGAGIVFRLGLQGCPWPPLRKDMTRPKK